MTPSLIALAIGVVVFAILVGLSVAGEVGQPPPPPRQADEDEFPGPLALARAAQAGQPGLADTSQRPVPGPSWWRVWSDHLSVWRTGGVRKSGRHAQDRLAGPTEEFPATGSPEHAVKAAFAEAFTGPPPAVGEQTRLLPTLGPASVLAEMLRRQAADLPDVPGGDR